jgi:hypothetical protein
LHIECQRSSENPIYEGKKVVELGLGRGQTRQKFANSSRIHEDGDVETVADPQGDFSSPVAEKFW